MAGSTIRADVVIMNKALSSTNGFAWNFSYHAESFVKDGLGDGNIDKAIKPHLYQFQGPTAKYEGADPKIAV
jgi:hypothetical protein